MDKRDELIGKVCQKLAMKLDTEAVDMIRNTLVTELDKYEVQDRCTALAVRESESENLMKLFAGAKITEGCSPETVKEYIRTLRDFMTKAETTLKDANAYHLRLYLLKTQQSGANLTTCENYRSYINSFYSFLTEEDYIPKNPMKKVKPIKTNPKKEKAFTDVELDKIRAACKSERNRAIIELLLASGIRVEELCDLKVSDIDQRTMEVHVRAGKGNKSRTTYINELALEYLNKYLATKKRESEYLFSTQREDRIGTDCVRYFMKVIGKTAGVQGVHPHRFRRTFATRMYARGVDIRTIQILMGHSDINTTMIYIAQEDRRVEMQYKMAA